MRHAATPLKAVCVGGGTGTPASLRALGLLDAERSAVVSVADDGGSSGLLRAHTGQVPPGDVRKCLTALAAQQNDPWVKAFKTRFEYANNHTLGNLILTALTQATGSLTESIALAEQLLDARGHVHPASLESVRLDGITRDGQRLTGQATLCRSETALAEVALEPMQAQANPAAVAALRAADLIVLGPGSLYTSIIPNLLIGGIRDAVRASQATVVFVCPVADVEGETWGLDAAELTEAVLAHGLAGRLDYVIAHQPEPEKDAGMVTGYFTAIDSSAKQTQQSPPHTLKTTRAVALDAHILARIRSLGVRVLVRNLANAAKPTTHDPRALASAFANLMADSKAATTATWATMEQGTEREKG